MSQEPETDKGSVRPRPGASLTSRHGGCCHDGCCGGHGCYGEAEDMRVTLRLEQTELG